MNDIAIRVDNLSKRYRIGQREPYKALRDVLTSFMYAPFRHLRKSSQSAIHNPQSKEFIWALKDVSFEVKRGEVIGIIGRNGAGKTTLLKILSRITEPTGGHCEIHGRAGSLLEVGTGFHPELTGRENIYLNGAILGMKKAEIDEKFDEIVAFAEIEKFIDTPVKYYSSGMYVRLAFAVAAHLEPEILLVDEVLAVGDIEFQKKCIGKMEKITEEGRTVAVVSHSMSTVKALCTKAILLERGAIAAIGQVDAVVNEYLSSNRVDASEKIISDEDYLTGVKQIRVKRIRLLNSVTNSFSVYWRQRIKVSVDMEVLELIEDVTLGAGIRTLDGTKVFTVHHDDDGSYPLLKLRPGNYTIEFSLQNDLMPGLYKLHVGADREHLRLKNLFAVEAVTLEVLDHSIGGAIPLASNEGLINARSNWKIENLR